MGRVRRMRPPVAYGRIIRILRPVVRFTGRVFRLEETAQHGTSVVLVCIVFYE